jgi:hypothetical protein
VIKSILEGLYQYLEADQRGGIDLRFLGGGRFLPFSVGTDQQGLKARTMNALREVEQDSAELVHLLETKERARSMSLSPLHNLGANEQRIQEKAEHPTHGPHPSERNGLKPASPPSNHLTRNTPN